MRKLAIVLVALLVALSTVAMAQSIGGPAAKNGTVPWVNYSFDETVLIDNKTPSSVPLGEVPAGHSLLVKSYSFGNISTGPETSCTSNIGSQAWWATAPQGLNCLQVDGVDLHCPKSPLGGSWYGPGATSGRVEFPGPGIVINSGSKLTAFLQGYGKCRFYGTVIGTLIAN